MRKFLHNDLDLIFDEKTSSMITLMPSGTYSNNDIEHFKKFALPPFQLAIASRPHGRCYSLVNGATAIPLEMELISADQNKNITTLTYLHKELLLQVKINIEFVEGCNVIRQICEVKNLSDIEHVITHFSSVCLEGVGGVGKKAWTDDDKLFIHYSRTFGQAENQWCCNNIKDFGMYSACVHTSAGSAQFLSVGSRSNGQYAPMAVLENKETNQSWFFQLETSTSWFFEIGNRAPSTDEKSSLFIHTTTADERYLGFLKKLKKGEKYTSMPTAYGCVTGGFNEAIFELTKYRRSRLYKSIPFEALPVIFNDYNNCLWAEPTDKKLIPLIDAAAKSGAEIFCIDAGWYCQVGDINNHLGDWTPCDELFGSYGFKGILDYIKSKQMLPGCWLEIESCGENSDLAKKPDDWFIFRNGYKVQDNPRLYLNFSNLDVRNYFMGIFETLYSQGIRYIKNDYNGCVGNGTDLNGTTSPIDGFHDYIRAVYSFFDDVTSKYPDLIFENCSSGGLRQDYGILSHFHLQSTSDQEIYYKYPFVLLGAFASMLPEHCGIWSYPYPLLFNNKDDFSILSSPEYLKSMSDGEETIFNMVNSMCGVMILSGHINHADKLNDSLIREGVSLYKKIRNHIYGSYPVFPIGIATLNNPTGFAVLGLRKEDKMLLFVWRNEGEDTCIIPVDAKSVKQIYPSNGFDVDYSLNNNLLSIKYDKSRSARIFEIGCEE